eukprot:RCo051545
MRYGQAPSKGLGGVHPVHPEREHGVPRGVDHLLREQSAGVVVKAGRGVPRNAHALQAGDEVVGARHGRRRRARTGGSCALHTALQRLQQHLNWRRRAMNTGRNKRRRRRGLSLATGEDFNGLPHAAQGHPEANLLQRNTEGRSHRDAVELKLNPQGNHLHCEEVALGEPPVQLRLRGLAVEKDRGVAQPAREGQALRKVVLPKGVVVGVVHRCVSRHHPDREQVRGVSWVLHPHNEGLHSIPGGHVHHLLRQNRCRALDLAGRDLAENVALDAAHALHKGVTPVEAELLRGIGLCSLPLRGGCGLQEEGRSRGVTREAD